MAARGAARRGRPARRRSRRWPGRSRRWLEALGGGPEGDLRLEPSPDALAEVAAEADLEAALATALRERRPREIQAAQTLSGPHRDDLLIAAGDARPAPRRQPGRAAHGRAGAAAGRPATTCGARSARPILLLDDVLSELDPDRRRLLLEAVRDGGQTLVTSADPAAAEALASPPDAPGAGRGRARSRLSGRRAAAGAGASLAAAADGSPASAAARAGGAGAGAETAAAALAWADVVGRGRRRPQRAGAPQPRRRADRRLRQRVLGAGAVGAARRAGRAASPSAAPRRPSRPSASRWPTTRCPRRRRRAPRRRRRRRPRRGPRSATLGPPRPPAWPTSRRCAIWSRAPPRRRPRAGERS